MYNDIFPEPATVLQMEPEELGPLVLLYLSHAGQQKLNLHNFSLGNGRDFIDWAGENQNERNAILEKFMIAWKWLEKELFLAPKPGSIEWYFITEKGQRLLEHENFENYQSEGLLPSEWLIPELVRTSKQSFIRGDFDTAVFQAFREVEVKVREKSGLGAGVIGVQLMRQAFHPDTGPLTDQSMEGGEKQARMELFSGAMGAYKNPASHRYVDYSDAHDVVSVILFANHLLKIVDLIEVPEEN